ncbi:hypothetical protein K493DRAFT_360088 [Basidiobolus meristosporus CBS 931.73]|uniref:SUI1 domain-containing protein n=1 Tax=Basidiobolus meristosporus CBS 931.73 TaxID=1314790 RepID=A0A1Y1XLJ9_9FUNG|nr:hypothetical protein K493DRAFT_360088 [Basidiobolus meristosporus CBS 931.73]|eukprot:ORX86629.1 hypothetical protein K493DRAFT_360088 [Basidiobolus meristosporus CBS 931.73]
MAIDTSEIPTSGPRKGKGVYILHVYRDHLWSHGEKSDPPEFKSLEAVAENETEAADGVVEASPEEPEEKQELNLSVAEVDKIFEASLLQALKVKLTPDGASQHLPMMASAFYSGYVLASRPVNVDIKQSSYKKVAKLFKAMEKKGLFKCKEMRGELHLMSVNWQHKEKGNVKPIQISIEARQGRKAVTKITGMENFQVSVNDLAKQLQTLCASSVAVNELPIGKNTPHPIAEILVQGHQEKKVTEELIARGVPSKHLQVTDKTAKKKK